MKLGAHMPTAGGLFKAIEWGEKIGCNTIQLFVKNNMQWFAPALSKEEVRKFSDRASRSSIAPLIGHNGYLINLAAGPCDNRNKSCQALALELDRATQLGLSALVMHPGSHLGAGEDTGLRQIVKGLNELLKGASRHGPKIALEITAGQGFHLGYRFEHLAEIIGRVDSPDRFCVCLDTCHLFAAGYDLRSQKAYEKVMQQFERIIGFRKLGVIHLNDSKGDLGSKLDRHEHIGKGRIGLECFRCFLNDSRLEHVPMILETPKSKDLHEDVENLKVLRNLIRGE